MNVRNITFGVYGGLAGGVVFGAMMGMMGMLPMIPLGLQALPKAVTDPIDYHSQVSARYVQNLTNFIAAQPIHLAQDECHALLSRCAFKTILEKFSDFRSIELNVNRLWRSDPATDGLRSRVDGSSVWGPHRFLAVSPME